MWSCDAAWCRRGGDVLTAGVLKANAHGILIYFCFLGRAGLFLSGRFYLFPSFLLKAGDDAKLYTLDIALPFCSCGETVHLHRQTLLSFPPSLMLPIITCRLPMFLPNLNTIDINPILKPPLGLGNLDIIGTHHPTLSQPSPCRGDDSNGGKGKPFLHLAVGSKSPILKPVAAPPLVGNIAKLVPKLHGNPVPFKGEQLLSKPVVAFAVVRQPLVRQERHDLVRAPQERVSVAPDARWRICFRHPLWISIPSVSYEGVSKGREGGEGETECSRVLVRLLLLRGPLPR